jgi:hypothetical protein
VLLVLALPWANLFRAFQADDENTSMVDHSYFHVRHISRTLTLRR